MRIVAVKTKTHAIANNIVYTSLLGDDCGPSLMFAAPGVGACSRNTAPDISGIIHNF